MKKAKTLPWYQTRRMYGLWAGLALLLAYVFASLAIDSGSLLQYFITIGLAIAGMRFLYLAAAQRHGN